MSTLQENLNAILLDKTTNLLPEHLKAGVTCLGVNGTYEGSGGGTVEGVKLFETQEAMQADPDAKEGDLAVVYRSEVQNIKDGDIITSMIFPRTVVLNKAVTNEYRAIISGDVEPSVFCDITLYSDMFMLSDMNGNIPEITYTSSDGITYTRTDSNADRFEIGKTTISDLDEVICSFIQTDGMFFGGLNKCYYTNSIANNYFYKNITIENGNISCEYTDLIDTYNIISLLYEESGGCNAGIIKQIDTDNYIVYTLDIQQNGYWTEPTLRYNEDGTFGISTTRLDFIPKKYIINLADNTCTEEVVTEYTSMSVKPYGNVYVYDTISSTDIILSFNGYTNTKSQDIYFLVDSNYEYGYINMKDNLIYRYTPAPSQLTANDDAVYSSIYYGKDGLGSGTLQSVVCKNQTQLAKRVDLWNIYNNGLVCPKSTSSALAGRSDLVTVPMLDMTNTVKSDSMFKDCTNLTNVSLINTNSVTDYSYMFYGCSKLVSVAELDASSAKNCGYMFEYCKNLTDINIVNSNLFTNAVCMFDGCTSLVSISNLSTNSVTSMNYMFRNCKSLTTIPQLDTSNVTDMNYTFYNCTNLSEESLNNILAMCTNATKITNVSYKTLKYIGLTSDQATRCQSLSNYQAFLDAGWTTGY